MQEMTNNVVSDYLVSREVMKLARISRRTLDRWVESGRLPVTRIAGGQRRYSRAAVIALLSPDESVASLPSERAS